MDRVLTIHNGQLTEHFNLWEFAHQSGAEIEINPDFIFVFVPLLEAFRKWYARPINITSCYRPATYNAIVGGSSNSSHLHTWAVDFPLPKEFYDYSAARKNMFYQNVKRKWVELCHASGVFAQCNFYDNRLHLGISRKSDSFLDYRTKK